MKVAATALGLGYVFCSFKKVNEDARNGLVRIKFSNYATGNCVAISASGLALTTKHSTFERSTTEENQFVEIVATDPTRDIAVVQLPRHKRYSYVKLGDSATVLPGEEVLLCGHGRQEFSCNSGFIHGQDAQFMYSGALMVHGQSGGALFNANGEVIGINKGHLYCTEEKKQKDPYHAGPSYFVPVNQAKELLSQCCEETPSGWKLKSKAIF